MLTDTRVRNAKPADRPRMLYDSRGLYLQATPHGGRWWRFSYRLHDKNKTLSLGIYPDVSLAMDRARHSEARGQAGSSRKVSSLRRRNVRSLGIRNGDT
jgi:hypothetical protein